MTNKNSEKKTANKKVKLPRRRKNSLDRSVVKTKNFTHSSCRCHKKKMFFIINFDYINF